MKKFILLFVLLSVQIVSYSQLNVGANAILHFPTGDYDNLSKFGYGGNASLGYTFGQRVELSIVYSRYVYTKWAKKEFSLNSKTVEAKYYILTGKTRPYFGCGVGRATETFSLYQFGTMTYNFWLVEPKIGALFNSGMLNNLFVDTSVSWLRADLEGRGPNAINISVGLKYFVNFK